MAAVTTPIPNGTQIELPNPNGRVAAAFSRPVVKCNEDADKDDDIVASLAAIEAASASTDPVATVGLTVRPSVNFNRPADTTAYASGDIVANSTTAGSVAALEFTVARIVGGTGMIRRAKLRKSNTNVTNAQFRLHLFSAAPTVTTAGDNSAFASNVAGVAGYLGSFDFTLAAIVNDGPHAIALPNVGSEINFVATAQKVYGLLEARAAYTPASGETFTVELEVLQN